MEVVGDLDELLDWFRETELQLREAKPPSSDPEVIRVQLKEHKILGEEVSTQKGRVRDVLSTAKKMLREAAQSEDSGIIREKMEDLKVSCYFLISSPKFLFNFIYNYFYSISENREQQIVCLL